MWWDDALSKAKAFSLALYNCWKSDGFPKSGKSFAAYHEAKKTFKKLAQKTKKGSQTKVSKNLLNSLEQNNNSKFWRLWNSNFKSKNATDNFKFKGKSNAKDTANYLAENFKETCSPNSSEFNSEQQRLFKGHANVNNSCPMPCITVDMLDKAIDSISNHTASSHDSIAIEHIKYAHPSLIIILCRLFNICLLLGIVPDDFCHGIVTPIPKFKGSKVNVVPDDFRSITVSPIASKILSIAYYRFLNVSRHQVDSLDLRKVLAV